MSPERRRRGVWAMIIDDPYRKMVAIGLAVLLWFFIESRIMDSETFTLPLNTGDQMRVQNVGRDSTEFVVFLPSGIEEDEFLDGETVVTTVQVKMSGPRYRIDALKNDPLRLKVMTTLGRQWNRDSDVEVVELTAADIERDIRRDDITIELIPPRIRLKVKINDTVTGPVDLSMIEFVTSGDESRMRIDSAQILPSEITLVGPSKHVHRMINGGDGQKPFRAEFKFSSHEKVATARLTVVDGVKLGVFPEKPIPQVTVPLAALRVTYTLKLPLGIEDKRLDKSTRYEADEKVVPVEVSFSGGLGRVMQQMDDDGRQEWASKFLRLEVYLDEPSNGVPLGPELQPTPYILLDGRKSYPRTEYRLEESLVVTVRAK